MNEYRIMSNAFSTYGDHCICLLRPNVVKCIDIKPSLLIWNKPNLIFHPTSQNFVILKTWNIQIIYILIIFVFKLTIFHICFICVYTYISHTYFYLTMWKQITTSWHVISKYFSKHLLILLKAQNKNTVSNDYIPTPYFKKITIV